MYYEPWFSDREYWFSFDTPDRDFNMTGWWDVHDEILAFEIKNLSYVPHEAWYRSRFGGELADSDSALDCIYYPF
jgi:hypothetical protein